MANQPGQPPMHAFSNGTLKTELDDKDFRSMFPFCVFHWLFAAMKCYVHHYSDTDSEEEPPRCAQKVGPALPAEVANSLAQATGESHRLNAGISTSSVLNSAALASTYLP